MKRFATLLLCVFALKLSAQTVLDAPGLAAFIAVIVAGGGGGGDFTTGLTHRWKLDEGTGSTAADAIGGNTGSLIGTSTWRAGKIGANAGSFDGGGGVSISTITTTTTFTYSAWIYQDAASGYRNLLTQGNTSGIWMNGGKIDFYYSGDHLSSATVSTGAWHHIAVVCNAGSVTYYIDSVADANTYSSAPSFDANGFAGDSGGGAESFTGGQDDVRLYSGALTSGNITTIFNFTGP